MLQRAYGSERAKLIQPERGMFVTGYFFNNWLPLLGHSALTIILAARSMCYWNPMTGELRNVVETEMGELAERAAVSVRTVKDVLNAELVQRYFLRYRVRRVMTANGVRTAGISLQVRMDDPLTPLDQVKTGLMEEEGVVPAGVLGGRRMICCLPLRGTTSWKRFRKKSIKPEIKMRVDKCISPPAGIRNQPGSIMLQRGG